MAKKSGKASSKAASKPVEPSAKPAARSKPRRLKQPQYKSFRLQKRIKHPVRMPNVWRLAKTAAQTLWQHKWLFVGITLIYALLSLLLGQGFSGGTDVSSLKDELSQVFTGNIGALASSVSIFVAMVGSAGSNTGNTAGPYQLILAVIASLAIIWSFRQVLAGHAVKVRDAYYRGMYPLIPFVLILLVIGLQLIPLLIGSTIYGVVINNGIAVYGVEKLIWGLLFALLALLSLYMITSSVFALYIVTLPNMTPLRALRSARELVRYRRWTVMRKMLFLPVALLVVAAAIMLPIILWLTPLAQWIFFLLTMLVLAAVHGYMYMLYRELLRE